MWNYLGDSLMKKLRNKYDEEQNVYARTIREAEESLRDEQISGHEAAKKILEQIFDVK